jgi:hypothetical protein
MIPKLFYITHGLHGDSTVSYEGQDQATAERLLTERGLTFDFADEVTYDAFIQAHKRPGIIPPDLTQEKAVLKDKTAKAEDRLEALIHILGL